MKDKKHHYLKAKCIVEQYEAKHGNNESKSLLLDDDMKTLINNERLATELKMLARLIRKEHGGCNDYCLTHFEEMFYCVDKTSLLGSVIAGIIKINK